MTDFIPKRITPTETIGAKLRQARLARNLSLDSISKKIKIRVEYLSAIENDQLDKLPSGLYGKSFIKQYGVYLGLKPKQIIKDLNLEYLDEAEANPFSQKILNSRKLIVWPKIIRNILAFGAVLICFLYLTIYFKNIVTPPSLDIISPERNILITENSILVSGQSEPEAEIKINGEVVLNNNKGAFTQEVNLKKGLNSITITAQKKHSRANTIIRQILVE